MRFVFCASIARPFLFAAALILSLSSCSRRGPEADFGAAAATGSAPLPVAEKEAKEDPPKPAEAWPGSKSALLVLCGQNYPEESGIANYVLWEYGLARIKPDVRFLYWPRTFEKEDASLRLLSNTARSQRPKTVVTIGAPEGTLRELRRIRNELPEAKIVSIFPSDDALATEAVSDMVIDMDISDIESSGIGEDIAEEEETAVDIAPREAAVLLLGVAISMEESAGNGAPESALLEAAMRFADEAAMNADTAFYPPRWQYVHAIDPDTGLRSRRHVLIRREQGAVRPDLP